MKLCIQMQERDQVATVLQKTSPGDVLQVMDQRKNTLFSIRADEEIPFAHKISLRTIQKGELLYKFGVVIGRATAEIPAGRHVHVHNLISIKGAEEVRKKAIP